MRGFHYFVLEKMGRGDILVDNNMVFAILLLLGVGPFDIVGKGVLGGGEITSL
jgi:hypothetical protein